MLPEKKYFKIGVFVLGASAIFAAGIMVLGVGSFFTKKTRAETYIDESIQGLDVGAPVKYRGVKVGELEATDFVATHYDLKDARIRLIMTFSKEVGQRVVKGTPEERIRRLVDMGMRVHLASEGLMGGVYLELDLMNPKENPPPGISWKPDFAYLPAVPSMESKMTNQVQGILDQMGTIRFDEISEKMVALLGDVDTVVKKLDPLFSDVSSMVADADGLIKDARVTAGHLPQTLENVDGTLKEMTATLHRVDRTLASGSGPMGEALDNLRVASGDLRELMGELKQYPSHALFGEPPPKKQVAK